MGLFAGELERVLPPVRLRELRNIDVAPNGCLFQGWRLLPESFAHAHLHEQIRLRSRVKQIVLNRAVRKKRNIDAPVVWATDTWSVGYFHWLADVLPRLYLVRDLLPDVTLLFPAAFRHLEFVQSTLDLFAPRFVDFMESHECVHCRTMLLPEPVAPSGHFDEDIIRAIRTMVVERYGRVRPTASAEGYGGPPEHAQRQKADSTTDQRGERVYISRGGAGRRRIVNEEEVIDLLSARGFRIAHPERLPFLEQVALCAAAGVLVSNHGAGLANMLFMPEGASVLELRHDGDAVNNCFFTMASALRLRYFFQGCLPVDPTEDPHTADIVVDVDQLRANLDVVARGLRP